MDKTKGVNCVDMIIFAMISVILVLSLRPRDNKPIDTVNVYNTSNKFQDKFEDKVKKIIEAMEKLFKKIKEKLKKK